MRSLRQPGGLQVSARLLCMCVCRLAGGCPQECAGRVAGISQPFAAWHHSAQAPAPCHAPQGNLPACHTLLATEGVLPTPPPHRAGAGIAAWRVALVAHVLCSGAGRYAGRVHEQALGSSKERSSEFHGVFTQPALSWACLSMRALALLPRSCQPPTCPALPRPGPPTVALPLT